MSDKNPEGSAGDAAGQRVTVVAGDATVTARGPVTLTAGEAAPADPAKEFKLERYKYILGQINFLNESLHKYLTLFQTLATAILAAGVAVFVSWRKLEITAEVAQLAIHSLMLLLGLLAFYVVASIFAGIFSWWDYRKDEVKLLKTLGGTPFREPPEFKGNVLRWYETQAILFIAVVTFAAIYFVEYYIIPLIHP
ncbi:MAG TPA: hypothetical protein VNZ44_07305 [Pyrinomonadaceae bacterium]|nr:hypothetical protein [Pyrinomonadaceae bacterium]